MRVLVTFGSKRGGTEGIARAIAEALLVEGLEVELAPPREALRVRDFDAVVVGGALYATRWHKDARRFVERRARDLRRVPTWFFSSGPLDDTANQTEIPPTKQVSILMERVGARGHRTFGGRLEPDAKGFPANAMAKKNAGDHRDMERIRAWAKDLARELPSARPLPVVHQPGRSVGTLLAHAVVAWAICGLAMTGLLWVAPLGTALAVHAFVVPIVFAFVARHYFAYRGARAALPAAATFALVVVALDAAVVGGLVQGNAGILRSVSGLWLPVALLFLATWMVGLVASLSPMKPPKARPA